MLQLRLVMLACIICGNVLNDVLSCDQELFIKMDRDTIQMKNITNQWIQNCSNTLENISIADIFRIVVTSSNIQLSTINDVLLKFNVSDKVKELEIIESGLTTVPSDIFISYRKVEWINLKSNEISVLEVNAFRDFEHLRTIYLSNNKLKEIVPFVFNNLPALRHLRIDNNRLEVIATNATGSIQLGVLILDNNRLRNIPYEAFKTVLYLYIAHNRLDTISPDITLLQNLVKLNVNNNNLTTLPFETETIFNRNKSHVQLGNNPWVCDCTLIWLIKLIKRGYTSETIFCDSPANISMAQFDITSMTCDVMILDSPVLSQPVIFLGVATGIIIMVCTAVSIVCLWKTRTSKARLPIKYQKHRRSTVVSTSNDECFYDEWNNIHNSDIGFGDTNGKLRLIKLIGRGAFGDVYKASASGPDNNWRNVAVKKLRDETSISALDREFQHLTAIGKHPNIIQIFGSGVINGSPIIVMELAELGDLLAHLRHLRRSSSKLVNNLDQSEERSYLQARNPQVFVFLWSIAKGMEFLSRLKIVHRDLAARNVLLTEGPNAKISDFGLSRDIYESGYYFQESQLYTRCILRRIRKYPMFHDWWEVVTLGGSPYPGIPPDMLQDMYKAGYHMPKPPLSPDQIYAIMQRCWKHTVDERPDFTELVEALDKFIQTCSNHDYLDVGSGVPMLGLDVGSGVPMFGLDRIEQ